jgi:glycosyltransferase involved in cell wall biosynthesis
VFLGMSDFHSVFERKNPLGSLTAYTRAFGPDDGATLVLKSINGSHHAAELDRLRQAAADRPDVIVVDGYVDAHRVQGLLERSDCLVSLHRSEGFGLNLADAMASGRPVIATGFSGNMAFMDEASAFLVPYDLVPVGPGHDPYPASAHWADPDLDVAADLMRRVFDDPGGAGLVGERGRTSVLERNGLERAGKVVMQLLMHEEPWWDAVATPFELGANGCR